jgi:actin related protein 2/3 complex subunit 1A/1B
MFGKKKEAKSQNILESVTVHAWNKDRTQLALSPNSEEIFIYDTPGDDPKKWVKKHTLREHTQHVSGLDWSAETDALVSCSHDRNAYVWKKTEEKGVVKWNPTIVILRSNRGATMVKWSPRGNKFAVSCGSKCVPVASFEAKNDWWVSILIKKPFKATVLCLAWSPNNKFLITGGTGMKCRIVSAYHDGLDDEDLGEYDGVFDNDKQNDFSAVLAEFDQTKAWVNAVAWSPNGKNIAFTGHGCTVHFGSVAAAGVVDNLQTIHWKDLPLTSMQFVGDDAVVAAGFNMNNAVFVQKGDEWEFKQWVEDTKAKKVVKKTNNAFNKFRAMADQGKNKSDASSSQNAIKTTHKNLITCNTWYKDKVICSFSVDGVIHFWDISKCL